MVCGGFGCDSSSCPSRPDCFYWPFVDPDNLGASPGGWYEAPSLLDARNNHLMATAPYLGADGEPLSPIVIGSGLTTEIFDTEAEEWVEYEEIDDPNWYGNRVSMFHVI